jgi:hypothetical protein
MKTWEVSQSASDASQSEVKCGLQQKASLRCSTCCTGSTHHLLVGGDAPGLLPADDDYDYIAMSNQLKKQQSLEFYQLQKGHNIKIIEEES